MNKEIVLKKINKDREKVEAAFVFSLWKDPDQYGDYLNINEGKDKTLTDSDAKFYFSLGKAMYKQGYRTFDHITLDTFLDGKPDVRKKYENFGGYRTIEELRNLVNTNNTEAYFDKICRMNSLSMITTKFDEMFENVERFENASNNDVYEAMDLLNNSISLTTNHSAKIETLTLTDSFIDELNAGEDVGLNYGKFAPILNYTTLGVPRGDLYMLAGHSGCVDANTEFFNGRTWKSIADYKDGESVLQWNKDGSAELVKPLRYIKAPCDMMYHFETKYGLDQTLSPEHRVVYINKGHHKNELCEITMEELYNRHVSTESGFGGTFITTFNYGGPGIDLSNEEIELMIAVMADGSFYSYSKEHQDSWLTCRFHIKKERKKLELKDLFERGNFEYREVESATEGYTDFYVKAPRREKFFSEYWYNCSHEQLLIICNNVLKWDGHVENTPKGGLRRSFSTCIKESADFIQFAFSACGYKATVKKYERHNKIKVTNNKEYERKSPEYNVVITERSGLKFNTHKENKTQIIKIKPEDGMKYCFTVPSSYLILRRNGHIFITGNCGKSSFIFNNIVIPLNEQGIGVGIISNEMRSKTYKMLLLIYVLTHELNYWKMTRKKLKMGNFNEEEHEMLRKAQNIINEKYSNIKFIKLESDNLEMVFKHIKKMAHMGVTAFMFDTFKSDDVMNTAMWESLLLNSRKLYHLVDSLNIGMVLTYQLALYTTNQRWLDAGCLSNGKQIKEVFSEMVYMRQLWADEYTNEKYDCKPWRFKKVGDTRIKENIELDPEKKYIVCFVDKTRNDEDKKTILFQWDGQWNKWQEIGFCTIVNDHRGMN